MNSNWDSKALAAWRSNASNLSQDLADCVYMTRLLGQDPELVLHGGGNTSVKTRECDPLSAETAVLRVKGSGWDMGTIEAEGLPALALEPLLAFRAFSEMPDEAMVNAFRRNLLDGRSPMPSVETLLHAFLPHKFIAHTHADAVLALLNQANAAEWAHELSGGKLLCLPYIMPGFSLAKRAILAYEEAPDCEGLLLLNHGILTWGQTAEQAYERMIAWVDAAERLIQAKLGAHPFSAPASACAHPAGPQPESGLQRLAWLRRHASEHPKGTGSVIAVCRTTSEIDALLENPAHAALLARGPITPDHIIRIKQAPLLLEPCESLEAFGSHAATAFDNYIREYESYFQTQSAAKGLSRRMLSPLPVLVLVPGLGAVALCRDAKAAETALDLFEHNLRVALVAERLGSYRPLGQSELFDMEYWSLEQAKLGKLKPAPLAGQVVLITGAVGGIGRATAELFAAEGANLLLTDLEPAALEELASDLGRRFGVRAVGLAGDLRTPGFAPQLVAQALARFGGLDLLISNAGRAFTGAIDEATEALQQSLEINLLSHQRLAAAAIPWLIRQGRGCLLFNGSKSAFNPGPEFGPYSVAKAALIALMRQYALEYADRGIRASAVNADRVRTGLFDLDLIRTRAAARGLEPDAYFRANLLGREVTASDVAQAFLHLYKAEKTTGAVLTVDGGNIAAAPR